MCTEHVEFAQQRDVPFISVNITCGPNDNQLRYRDPNRYQGSKSKLQDSCALEQLLSNHRLLDPTACPSFGMQDTRTEIHHVDLDTAGLSAEESALRILDFARGSSKS